MKYTDFRTLSVVSAVLVALTVSAAAVDFSKNAKRAGKWEVFFAPTWMDDVQFSGKNGSSADVNGRSSLGMGFAYNINDNIEVGMLFNGSYGNYSAEGIDDEGAKHSYNGTMYTSTMAASAAYNFLDGPLTPYVGANLGFTYIDSNIPSGEAVGGCWYDPWWGYVCGNYPLTYTSTNFSYGADAGVRLDVDSMFMKAGIGKNYIDWDSTIDTTYYTFVFGFKF